MKRLYYGRHIITMDADKTAEAVLTENGRICKVGKMEDLEKEADEKIALGNSTLLPGFVDPHSHFFQVALAQLRVPLGGISQIEEMERVIQKFIADRSIAPGQWVNGRDYDNNIMPQLKNPSIEELDRFAPHNPLVIHFKSGHMGLMNSQALKLLGISPDMPQQPGGKIEVKDGKLTGYLEENAFFSAIEKIPMAGAEQLMKAFSSAQEKYASYGITTVQDGMVVDKMLPLYEMFLKTKSLYLDVFLYSAPGDYHETCRLLSEYPQEKHLHSGGMKIFLDGSPQGRTAWMREPYAGEKEYRAYGTMKDQAVEDAFAAAAEADTQLIAHCNGDAAAEQFLRCLEKAERQHPNLKKLHPVIIHGQLMGKDQLPAAKELGAYISFFAAHVYHWGDVHIRNFGMERASCISPARSAMEAGINVTFHQDSPVIEPDMLETMWVACCRKTKQGVSLEETERVTIPQALAAVTINGAQQYGKEDCFGSIAPGKKADFVILNQNPLTADPEKLRDIKILATIKEDRVIYRG